MKFAIDCQIEVGDTLVPSATLLDQLDDLRDDLGDVNLLEGKLVLTFDGQEGASAEYTDPIYRLVDGWLRKVQWIMAGDTETVVLRNSEHCFALVPAGTAVEISFFEGDAAEIEEYVLEPTNVLLTDYIQESIRFGEQVIGLIQALDSELLENNEDCKDLSRSLGEATTAWKKHLVRQRR